MSVDIYTGHFHSCQSQSIISFDFLVLDMFFWIPLFIALLTVKIMPSSKYMFSVETVGPAPRTALCLDKAAAVREVSAEDEDVPQERSHQVRHGD